MLSITTGRQLWFPCSGGSGRVLRVIQWGVAVSLASCDPSFRRSKWIFCCRRLVGGQEIFQVMRNLAHCVARSMVVRGIRCDLLF